MKTVGIIAEYNPFHNGHAYLMSEAKRQANADYTIVVMSGSFMQRGIPSCMYKYDRVKSALLCGADLVLELPVSYSTATAEVFAHGAVSILNSINITDFLAFGSECGNIDTLNSVADELLSPSPEYESDLKEALSKGYSYPAARNIVLSKYNDILEYPNNILSIEYLKAIKRINSTLLPITIKRFGQNYHDTSICEYASANAIRTHVKESMDLDTISQSIPQVVSELYKNEYSHTWPIDIEDFNQVIHYALLNTDHDKLLQIQDLNSDLANKILKTVIEYKDITEFISKLKSKDITYTRISRALLHIMLNQVDLTRSDDGSVKNCPYSRILGFKKSARPLLHELSKKSDIPIINKVADASSILSNEALNMFKYDVNADRIYNSAVYNKYGTHLTDGCLISPLII